MNDDLFDLVRFRMRIRCNQMNFIAFLCQRSTFLVEDARIVGCVPRTDMANSYARVRFVFGHVSGNHKSMRYTSSQAVLVLYGRRRSHEFLVQFD